MKYHVKVYEDYPYEGLQEMRSEEFETLEDAIAAAKIEDADREDDYVAVKIEVEGWRVE